MTADRTPDGMLAGLLPSRREFMAALGAGSAATALPFNSALAQAEAATGGNGLITRESWAAMLDRLKAIDAQVDPALIADPIVRDRFYSHSLQVMAVFYAYAMMADVSNPHWLPLQNYVFTTASPNPDTIYYCAPITDAGSYRISGRAGSHNIINFQWGQNVVGRGWPGPRLGGVSVSDLGTDEHGNFELFLGGTPPAGKESQWRPLPENAAMASIRVIGADWENVRSPAFAIERLDTPVRPAWPNTEPNEDRLERFASAVEQWTHVFVQLLPGRIPEGTLSSEDFDGQGGLSGQYYYNGRFELARDEALLIEAQVPTRSDYWNIQLDDDLFSSFDYASLQCSLNHLQAHVDDDGVFRAVIALEDPGVPNWLDTGGYPRGIVIGRWLNADSPVTPDMIRIKLADLRAYLPASHPNVSRQERERALRRRRELVQLRRLW